MTRPFIQFWLLLFFLSCIGEVRLNAQVETIRSSGDTVPARKDIPPPPPPPPPVEEQVFKVVPDMPRFPGCEDIADDEKRKECARQRMLQFIQTQLRYPKEAAELGIEGRAVIQFIVDKDGSVIDPKIVRDPGYGLGEEALRAVRGIPGRGIRFTPGPSRGRAVKVQLNVPVEFRLDGSIPIEE
ncbi:MAG: energy transducer TonB [Phaeodactylibacter sp.]|nr:energy transducer TonB [Phaeodactylibacter sp.]MCB9295804.1 energy transducer TonB [Lewinellaceae bacterium]